MKQLILALTFSYCLAAQGQNVQWVSKILEVSSERSSRQNSAGQVIGPPSIFPQGGKSTCAWEPGGRSKIEYIKVGFKRPMKPKQVIIAENLYPGSVFKIFLMDKFGKEHLVKKLKKQKPVEKSRILHIPLKEIKFETTAMKIELYALDIDSLPQIDAIGIADTDNLYVPTINLIDIPMAQEAVNLGHSINTMYKEVSPVISPDNKVLYFTRDDDPANIGGDKQDIWYSEIDSTGNFSMAKNLGRPINNERNNNACAITPDGQTMLVGHIYNSSGLSGGEGLSITKKVDNNWSLPEKLNIKNYNNRGQFFSAYLANDGKTLILGITRNDTYGGEDLYVSFRDKNNDWSQPLNLGNKINTSADDYTPFLASDMTTLYYTSEGMPGFGIGDIYMSKRLDDTWRNWSDPVNLGPAFNTPLSDFYFTIPASGEYAYFVSATKALGSSDIFRLKLPPQLQPNPVVLIKGKVYNLKTKLPLESDVFYEVLPEGEEKGKANADKLGRYQIVLPVGSIYGFRASHQGYISINANIDVKSIKKYTEVEKDLYLVPIEQGQIVRINNLFFESNKWDITESSYPELNRLAETMKQNPTVEIEIGGHTDDIGSDQDNLKLSEERAKKVSFYLYNKGVEFARMRSKGYGESKPLLPNDSEANRQQNRRVEFLIHKK